MSQLTLSKDMTVTTFRPSEGFDPFTASSAELVRNGFPQMPDDPRLRERYQSVLSHLKGKFHYITPTLQVNDRVSHGPRRSAGAETSTNWSGAVVFAPSGESFSWVQGDWVIPDVYPPTENEWYYAASWIGIDGDGSGDVCQMGIECEVYRSGTSITRNIYPWVEWFPISEAPITNFPVAPGDMVTALLCAGPGAGATQATAFFANRTTGASTSVAFNAPSGTVLAGNCAEWIVEAPTVNGSQSALADYGEVFFSVCEAFLGTINGGGSDVNGGSGDTIAMQDGGGTVVSTGTAITPSIVQCQYTGTLK